MRSSDNDDDAKLKKLKVGEEDPSQFNPGAIVRLKLKNFVTYALTEFCMSPSLNMVIGPNGSGKSTFVCGVCLGLAGKPEFIGRSKKVEDFIKNGEEECVIEVTLKRDNTSNQAYVDDNYLTTVTRVINRERKKSTYLLNGVSVTEQTVKQVVSELNIQLDNLCQFLSQERVQEFARLKPDKLLVETVRSVDLETLDIFQELIELQNTEVTEAKELSVKEHRYSELSVSREKLEASARTLEAFQQKKQEVMIHQKLLPYVKVQDHKLKLKSYKKACEESRAQLKSLLSDKKPFKDILDRISQEAIGKRMIKDDLENQFRRAKESFPKYVEKLNHYEEEVKLLQSKIKNYEGRTERIQEDIKSTREQLRREESKLANLSVPDESQLEHLSDERRKVNENILRLESERRSLLDTIESIRYRINSHKESLRRKELNLTSNDRIGILRNKGKRVDDVREAVLYVRGRAEMKGRVLEPPIMLVSAKDPRCAKYVATCVDFSTSIALTMADGDAYVRFNDEILKNFRVNLRELSSTQLTSPYPLSKLKELGFECYVSDLLTGDAKVIEMLCQQHRLHTIPVLGRNTRQLSPRVLKFLMTPDERGNLRFRRVIAGDYIYDFKRSSYGARQVFTVDFKMSETNLYKGNILSDEVREQINREINQLKENIRKDEEEVENTKESADSLGSELNAKKEIDSSLRSKASKINAARVAVTRTRHSIDSLKSKLEDLKRDSSVHVKSKVNECKQQIESAMKKKIKCISDVTNFISHLQKLDKDVSHATVQYLQSVNSELSMNEVVAFFNEKEVELRAEYETAKVNYASMKDTTEYKEWLADIRSYSSSDKDQLATVAENYQRDGNFNLAFIQGVLDSLKSEIAMFNEDESVLEILRQTENEMSTLNNIIPRKKEALYQVRNQMQEKQATLEPVLDEMISKISINFARLFKNVGSAGAVNLKKEQLFEDWKIEILVKFRDNASLKMLDSHTQSGGERSVSTVLYMIALQEFTSAPFRVVDEINQGMDATNERIVHKAMVENACVENTSQYILVTPKLLTQLFYHEKVRVHCVMAGPWLPNPVSETDKVHFGRSSAYVL
ncbi:LADA_0C10374g1_1 [Lachancea dasiensis]|uniref:Structural maintenance of chromosomes protein 5 n=1 Tax=Lachancea dasiensis TaxID=1072105 RepID=A0A1G4J1C3_9SACH|nr:LADA_0C10374g1_1 [Lachancea dasiensis]